MDEPSQFFGEKPFSRFGRAWRELHAALMAGIPHAADILSALDAHGLRYPTAPLFDNANADVECYRVIHRAWREGLLREFLDLLCLWRRSEGSLCDAARRMEFQTALVGFLLEHRCAGLQAILSCFAQPAAWRAVCEFGFGSVAELRHHLDLLWAGHHVRCAA